MLVRVQERDVVFAPSIRYFMQAPDAKGSDTPYGNNTAAGHYVQVGDAKIYYEVYGKGKPIFVFHGGVGTPYEMGQMIDKLRKDYQVIVVSTRGHGRSEIGHSELTYEQKADDMVAVMKEVTVKCPTLLIAGDEDDHAPLVTMMEAEQYIPNARLCIVTKAWHTAFLDNFEVTWTAIEQFLQTDKTQLDGSKKVDYNRK